MRTAYSVQRRTASVGLLFMIRLSCPLLASPPTSTHITNHSPQKRLFQRRCLLPWRKFKLLEHIQVSLEMTYLAMYGVVLVLIILVQVLISASQHGLLTLLGNRESLSSVGVAKRAEKTVQNSVVAMALVAPAVLMLTLANLSTPGTIFAIQLFLTTRIAYAICFLLGITLLRTVTWIVGFLATTYLYLSLL